MKGKILIFNFQSTIPELINEVNALTTFNEDVVAKNNAESQKYLDILMAKEKENENFNNNPREINHRQQLSDIERSTRQLQVRRFYDNLYYFIIT